MNNLRQWSVRLGECFSWEPPSLMLTDPAALNELIREDLEKARSFVLKGVAANSWGSREYQELAYVALMLRDETGNDSSWQAVVEASKRLNVMTMGITAAINILGNSDYFEQAEERQAATEYGWPFHMTATLAIAARLRSAAVTDF